MDVLRNSSWTLSLEYFWAAIEMVSQWGTWSEGGEQGKEVKNIIYIEKCNFILDTYDSEGGVTKNRR